SQLQQATQIWKHIVSPREYQVYANVEGMFPTYTITCKVGYDKMYVIKDIKAFLSALEERKTYQYGKNLEFQHCIEYFDEPSRKIIEFIRKVYQQQFTIQHYYMYRSTSKSLRIDSETIDLFYETFATLDPKYHNAKIAPNELISIPLQFESYNRKLSKLISPLLTTSYCLSKKYIYLEIDGLLYRYQEDTCKAVLPLLQQLEEEDLFFDSNTLTTFYCSYLAPIQEYIHIDQLPISIPEEVELRFYLEINEREDITLDVYYLQEEREQAVLDDQGKPLLITPKIAQFMALANACMLRDTKQEKQRYIITMSNKDFMTHVLPILKELGEVMVSNELLYRDKKTNYHFQVSVRLEGDVLKLAVTTPTISPDEVMQVLREYRKKKKFFKLKNGDILNLDSEELEEISEFLDQLQVSDQELQEEEIEVPAYRALTSEEIARHNKEIQIERSTTLQVYTKELSTPQEVYDIPLPFAGILRDYQKEGYQWLKHMEHYGFGCILADDMGLGKTIQVLSLLESSKQSGRTSLVICPSSLILNWADEVRKFSSLTCLCVQGSMITRHHQITSCMDYDIVITSYDYIRRDVDNYAPFTFYYTILDEAQYIKNQSTQNARSVKKLHSIHKLALSGTPIENSLAELWSIFDFLMPSYLYPYSYFRTHFETPIVRFQDEEVSQKLRSLVSPFVLRRVKRDVLKELPEKVESNLLLDFNEEENKIYQATLAQINQELAKALEAERYFDKMMILACMTRLRQICCDPRLLYDNIDTCSTKIKGCMELIETAYESHKPILLFSSFTSVLALLEEELRERNIRYLKLTGETSKEARHEMVERFQSGDIPIFLISLKAGGTGLNLTAAEVVIHFDPWWNLSAQNQATDRAHRLGQKNMVQVYKLIMKDSIEEKILKLQSLKSELANMFIEQSEISIRSMSQEELLDLFK
ncbi:MAG: DEAD/DEAH box helicase, partial [Erysipelotrichaceae bacterium]|nr:DEAD/DEAH box helicase [Erysipelotrichaceae bacterium]